MSYQGLSSIPLTPTKTAILRRALGQTGIPLERLTCEDIGGKIKRYIRRTYPVFYERNYGCRNEQMCMDYIVLLARSRKR